MWYASKQISENAIPGLLKIIKFSHLFSLFTDEIINFRKVGKI